ncbi:hypothetical protein [Thermococcus thermotolerans]|uniref:hypothetical protein n=1 Tax=Thermococcus thermotolerans TaxID=2969672 RepID=UPI002158315A|nr:hypothetical protein [Thermococcus thermotolerans]
MTKKRKFLYSMFFSFFFLSGAILDIRETNPQNWVVDSLILVMITTAVTIEYWYLSGLLFSKNKSRSYGVTIIITATTAVLLIKIFLGGYSQLVRYITFGAIISIFYGVSTLVISKYGNASKH